MLQTTAESHYGGQMNTKEAERAALQKFKAALYARIGSMYSFDRIVERPHDPLDLLSVTSMIHPELHDGVEVELVLGRGSRRSLFVLYCMNAGIDGLETIADDPKYVAARDAVNTQLRISNAEEARRERVRSEVMLAHPQFWCFCTEEFMDDKTRQIFNQVADDLHAFLQLHVQRKKLTKVQCDTFTPPSIRQAYHRQLERVGLKPKEGSEA